MFEEAQTLWREIISEFNLDHVAEKLSTLTAPAIGLTALSGNDKDLPPSASKLGGKPDLTATTIWPTWQGTPLAFIAQINLRDVAGHPFTECLPQTGLLSFFYHAYQETWGFDPEDKGSAAVLYSEDPSDTTARDFPKDLPKDGILPCAPFRMSAELTLPAHDSLPVQAWASVRKTMFTIGMLK